MPEIHLIQWTAAFAAALYLTCKWLLERPRSRWRHIVAGLVSTLLWVPVAYTAGNVAVADGGEAVSFGSDALGMFAIFMIVVNMAGLVLGLYVWAEEEVDEASEAAPDIQPRGGRT
ncbi:MAG: hypothetical protein ACOCQY_02945 [Halorhabdus sp.]